MLSAEVSRRKGARGSVALRQLADVVTGGLPRLGDRVGGEPGRTPGGGPIVLRGQLTPRTSNFPNTTTFHPTTGPEARLDTEMRCLALDAVVSALLRTRLFSLRVESRWDRRRPAVGCLAC